MNKQHPSFGRPTGDARTISKQARKIDQMRQTIDQLHERLASIQSSKRNKASQIGRLKKAICAAIVDLDETAGDAWKTVRDELRDQIGDVVFEGYVRENCGDETGATQ